MNLSEFIDKLYDIKKEQGELNVTLATTDEFEAEHPIFRIENQMFLKIDTDNGVLFIQNADS